jgi:hypothetical protein
MTQLRILCLFLCCLQANAQNLSGILQKASKIVDKKTLNSDELASGLKEALAIGADKGCALLAKPDGFFKNSARKIVMPAEAQRIESTLRSIGLNQIADELILSLNRAAEDACASAAPIFKKSISEMSVTDGLSILKGNETAATSYLRSKTHESLKQSFRPSIQASLEKVQATKYWAQALKAYQAIPFSNKKINPNLADYVTERALQGIFDEIALQEKEIRKNPMARTSEALKRLFEN